MRDHKDFIVDRLLKSNMTISFAESVTGGMVSATLVAVPHVSQVFKGSIVAYNPEAKMNLLNVKKETIQKCGTISAEIAREMAIGAIKKFNSNVSVGITGLAGPDGVENKPVGLYYFCIIIQDHAYEYEGRINKEEVVKMIRDINGEDNEHEQVILSRDEALTRTCYRRIMTMRIIEELSKLVIKQTTQPRI